METKKIVLIGDANVGKTSLVRKLQNQEMPINRIPTLGVEVVPVRVAINEYVSKVFNIWDCSGTEQYRGLGDGYWVQADGAIIMVDCLNTNTILNAESWRTQFRRMNENKPILVVVNKCEILTHDQRESLENVLPNVLSISCKDNINIEEVLKFFL